MCSNFMPNLSGCENKKQALGEIKESKPIVLDKTPEEKEKELWKSCSPQFIFDKNLNILGYVGDKENM